MSLNGSQSLSQSQTDTEPKLLITLMGDIPEGRRAVKMGMQVTFGSILKTLHLEGKLFHNGKELDPFSTPTSLGMTPGGCKLLFTGGPGPGAPPPRNPQQGGSSRPVTPNRDSRRGSSPPPPAPAQGNQTHQQPLASPRASSASYAEISSTNIGASSDPFLSLQAEVMLLRKTLVQRRDEVVSIQRENDRLAMAVEAPLESLPEPPAHLVEESRRLDIEIATARREQSRLKNKIQKLHNLRDYHRYLNSVLEELAVASEECYLAALPTTSDGVRCRDPQDSLQHLSKVMEAGLVKSERAATKVDAAWQENQKLRETTIELHKACLVAVQEVAKQ
jgi:hypothetical protein